MRDWRTVQVIRIVVAYSTPNGANMRRYLLVLPFVFACAKGEEAPADSAAMAAAPAVLTDADVSGTWTGTATNEAPDTGSVQFTISCGAGACKLTTSAAPNDTIALTYVLQADSSVGTSTPYPEPTSKAMVIDHYVARVNAGTVSGNGWLTLVDKPDSVVGRYRFTGTKAP